MYETDGPASNVRPLGESGYADAAQELPFLTGNSADRQEGVHACHRRGQELIPGCRHGIHGMRGSRQVSDATGEDPLKLLVFVGTEGKYHDHEQNGRFLTSMLSGSMLSGSKRIDASFSRDYEVLATGLSLFEAVLFYTDVGELTNTQERGLLSFVDSGGGFFGLHTAAASFRECEGYHRMLNGFFNGHSPHMKFTVTVSDPGDPITEGLADFEVTDELYYLKHDPGKSHHLLQAYDETRDETHVMAFKHTCGEGRVFFFALGHDMAVLENPNFQQVVLRGALWVGWRLAG